LQIPVTIFSLGDSAATIELGQQIDPVANDRALAIQQWLFKHPFDGMLEAVLAYSSLTIYYDPYIVKRNYQPDTPVCRWVEDRLRKACNAAQAEAPKGALHRIPVYYGGDDLHDMANTKSLGLDEIIAIHSNRRYRVYMIGFLPGFAYLGKVDTRIATPRKLKPVTVAAGSVAIAGEQTGIYPLESPGGWNVVGMTPVTLFNGKAREPVFMKPGDEVEFYAISKEEFQSAQN